MTPLPQREEGQGVVGGQRPSMKDAVAMAEFGAMIVAPEVPTEDLGE